MKPTLDEIKENPLAVAATQARSTVNDLNRAALIRLMHEHGFTLPRNALDWRPTAPERGSLRGIRDGVTVLCTDGVVAYFLSSDGSLLHGHNANFDGEIRPLHSVPKTTKAKEPGEPRGARKGRTPRTPRLSKLNEAIALLKPLTL